MATKDIQQSPTIEEGQKVPEGEFMVMDESSSEPRTVQLLDLIQGKRVVLFGLPGAYTSVCSSKHVPQFNARADDLKAKGIDEIVCVSVNDAYVMREWGKALNNDLNKVSLLADGEGTWHARIGLLQHLPGLGVRARRYSMLLDDAVVKVLNLEDLGGMSYKVSGPEHMLADIEAQKSGDKGEGATADAAPQDAPTSQVGTELLPPRESMLSRGVSPRLRNRGATCV